MIQLNFILNATGTPESKLADVDIIFNDGPLAGLKVVGTSVWKNRKGGDPNILVPSRSYNTSSGTRYYELLRGVDSEDKETITDFKDYIRAQYLEIVQNKTGQDN